MDQKEDMNFVSLVRTGRLYESDMAAQALEDEGIPFYRSQENSGGVEQAMVAPAMSPGHWFIIYVPEQHVEQAQAILADLPVAIHNDDSDGPWAFNPTNRARRVWKTYAAISLLITALALLLPLFF